MAKHYEQWELDELLEKEVSAVGEYGVAIYRVAALNVETGITMKFVRQIGGDTTTTWCNFCLNFKTQNNKGVEHFDWIVNAIRCGHFDLNTYKTHFQIVSGTGTASCAF